MVLLAALTACALAGILLVSAVCICAKKKRTAVGSDCIIVLGARVWPSGRMCNSLRYRCERALEIFGSGLADNIIVCGAQGKGEPVTEASAMHAFLLEHGVPQEKMIEEDKSTDTVENLRNARKIMDERGWTNAIIVTNDYHVERALWIARDAGIPACGAAAKSPDTLSARVMSRLRESASWVRYWLRKTWLRGRKQHV